MAKVQQISEITPSFAFTECDFYKDYEVSFKTSELGGIHALLPLHEMAVRCGLTDAHPRKKAGRKSYFSPEGKVALMFLKAYTGLSAPKLMEQLNANIHYQIFCGIRINSRDPLTNYKLIDDIALELSNRLRIQNQQEALAEAHSKNSTEHLWTRYMADESMVMRFAPMDAMVAAEAFMPTKWTWTFPWLRNAATMESAVASEPPSESIRTFT